MKRIQILVSVKQFNWNTTMLICLHIACSCFCVTEVCCWTVGAETEAYKAQIVTVWPFPEKVSHHCSKLWGTHPVSKCVMLLLFWHLGLPTLGLTFGLVCLWLSQVLSRGVVVSMCAVCARLTCMWSPRAPPWPSSLLLLCYCSYTRINAIQH